MARRVMEVKLGDRIGFGVSEEAAVAELEKAGLGDAGEDLRLTIGEIHFDDKRPGSRGHSVLTEQALILETEDRVIGVPFRELTIVWTYKEQEEQDEK